MDLRERFHANLLPEIRKNLIIVNIGQGLAKDLDDAISHAISVDVFLRDPTMNPRSSGSHSSGSRGSDPHAMEIDANRMGNGNTRETFMARMRGRCYGCGGQGHEKRNCSHRETTCHYCGRRGHLESVCQDKFMGLERNRGNKRPRQQISASSSVPFTLFPEEQVQIAATAPTPPATSPDYSTQIAQLQELLNRAQAMSPPQGGF